MATHTDVAFAVTLRLDKLIRETLAMAAEGHACIEIMDWMYKEERDGWKLYHNKDAAWYTDDTDPGAPVPVLHELLTDLGLDDQTRYEITYFRMHKERDLSNLVDHDGEYEDPFGLGYTLKLDYEPTPTPEVKPCPPKRKRKVPVSKHAPKRRGRKRAAGR